MRKLVFRMAAVIMTILLFSVAVCSAESKEVSKAKEFVKAQMFPQAKAVLEKRINDYPADVEAHFYLGIVYAQQESFGSADERFASAVGLEPDKYSARIGEEYQKMGFSRLKRGDIQTAGKMFDKAAEYQPALKKNICDTTYGLGNSADDYSCVNFYFVTSRYCGQYNAEIGQRLKKIANNQTTAESREKYLEYASKFVSIEEILEVPQPSFGWKVQGTNLVADLLPGQEAKRLFQLKEGQTTPYLILPQDNYRIRFDTPAQSLIIDDGNKKIFLTGDDHYEMGVTSGEKKIKFIAVKGGADITVIIKR